MKKILLLLLTFIGVSVSAAQVEVLYTKVLVSDFFGKQTYHEYPDKNILIEVPEGGVVQIEPVLKKSFDSEKFPTFYTIVDLNEEPWLRDANMFFIYPDCDFKDQKVDLTCTYWNSETQEGVIDSLLATYIIKSSNNFEEILTERPIYREKYSQIDAYKNTYNPYNEEKDNFSTFSRDREITVPLPFDGWIHAKVDVELEKNLPFNLIHKMSFKIIKATGEIIECDYVCDFPYTYEDLPIKVEATIIIKRTGIVQSTTDTDTQARLDTYSELLFTYNFIDNSPTSNVQINSDNWVEVYDFAGRKIKECYESKIRYDLDKGLYIVKSKERSYKIAL